MSIIDDLYYKFEAVPDSTIFRELKHFETWDRWLALMDDPRRPKPEKNDLIEEWMQERWNSFINDFQREAVESEGKLVVHRCLTVKDPDAFARSLGKKGGKRLGLYWTWNFEAAECHWAGDGQEIFLTGLVDLGAVNIEETVLANFHPDVGEEEKEIRLKKDAPVLLTSISLSETDPRWQFDPWIPLKA